MTCEHQWVDVSTFGRRSWLCSQCRMSVGFDPAEVPPTPERPQEIEQPSDAKTALGILGLILLSALVGLVGAAAFIFLTQLS